MRQNSDPEFAQILIKIRESNHDMMMLEKPNF